MTSAGIAGAISLEQPPGDDDHVLPRSGSAVGMDVRLHPHEAQRLQSLRSYAMLDAGPDDALDAVTRLAATICRTPISLISLVDEDRQFFLSRHGLELAMGPRSESVCSDAVADGAPLVVPDLTANDRYAQLSTVTGGPGFRAYAGVPIVGRDGLPLGALCVLDTTPRLFTADHLASLDDLARQVVATLELRRSDARDGLRSPLLVRNVDDPAALRRALDHHEFIPHFQPVLDLRTGVVTGFEALMRWQHPEYGLLAPGSFLAGLEAGLLATWAADVVFEGACRLLVELRDRQVILRDGMAVNLSGRQLSRPGVARRILDRLARHSLPAVAFTVEITETVEVEDLEVARAETLLLRRAGVHVVADDFGVGWSNLARMLVLPLCGLKIDRELVSEMVGDPVREQMVASAIELAATMGLDVIAEGVETAAVRDLLIELGCHRGQGWFYGPAVPADQVFALVAGRSPHTADFARHPMSA